MRMACAKLMFGKRGESGMTILEVVIALSIFMVASAGICALIVQSKHLSDSSRDHYVAVNLAKNRMERARNMQCSLLPLLTESNQYVDVSGGLVAPDQATYRRSTRVSNVGSNLVEVIVSVDIRDRGTWLFVAGNKEEVRTYYTEYQEP